jgi:hypothetical protein
MVGVQPVSKLGEPPRKRFFFRLLDFDQQHSCDVPRELAKAANITALGCD